MNRVDRAYLSKYHGDPKWCKDFSMIKDAAPVLDVYVGLLAEPDYMLFLGLRDNASEKLLAAGCNLVMSQRQFVNEMLRKKYYRRVGVIDEAEG